MDRRMMATTALHRLLPSPPTDGGEGGAGGGGAPPADQGQQQQDNQGQQGGGGGDAGGGAGKGGKGGGGKPQGEGPFYADWADDLKDNPTVLRYKSPEDMARALVAANNKLGVDPELLIRLPTNDDETKALYAKLGAPETPDGYKIELGEGATDADKAVAEAYAKAMHEAGPFPPGFVKASVDFWNAQTAAAAEAEKTAHEAAETEAKATLEKEWGADYANRSKEVGLMLMDEKLGGGQALLDELDDLGLGRSVHLAKLLGNLAVARREPGKMEGEGRSSDSGQMTPGQAKAARTVLENDPVKGAALRDKADPLHDTVVAERNRYFDLEQGLAPGTTKGA